MRRPGAEAGSGKPARSAGKGRGTPAAAVGNRHEEPWRGAVEYGSGMRAAVPGNGAGRDAGNMGGEPTGNGGSRYNALTCGAVENSFGIRAAVPGNGAGRGPETRMESRRATAETGVSSRAAEPWITGSESGRRAVSLRPDAESRTPEHSEAEAGSGPGRREGARAAGRSAENAGRELSGGSGQAAVRGSGEKCGSCEEPGADAGSGPEHREDVRAAGRSAENAGRRTSEADGRSRRLVLLGSTGSIGRQALEVVRAGKGRFTVEALTAGKNWELLATQAREFLPRVVAVADERYYTPLREALRGLPVEVLAGAEALGAVAAGHYGGGDMNRTCSVGSGDWRTAGGEDCDRVKTVVLNALVGFAGLAPTVAALLAGRFLALANKESLVAGGEAVTALASAREIRIIPVDSEHSAVFQCLAGEPSPARRLIITASGGPFLDTPAERLRDVTPAQALRHPRWSMGARITIDSATMFNKGFEVMEARWLFGIEASRIDVLVHPQAAVHSMVEFEDGAVKAQIGTADMRLPICYALTFPERTDFGGEAFDFGRWGDWTFRKPDRNRFPALDIAADCLERGGTAGCTMNAADEVAVAAFLDGKIRFTDIAHTVERTLAAADFERHPSVGTLAEADRQARGIAAGLVR